MASTAKQEQTSCILYFNGDFKSFPAFFDSCHVQANALGLPVGYLSSLDGTMDFEQFSAQKDPERGSPDDSDDDNGSKETTKLPSVNGDRSPGSADRARLFGTPGGNGSSDSLDHSAIARDFSSFDKAVSRLYTAMYAALGPFPRAIVKRVARNTNDPRVLFGCLKSYYWDERSDTISAVLTAFSTARQGDRSLIEFIEELAGMQEIFEANKAPMNEQVMITRLFLGVDRKYRQTIEVIKRKKNLTFFTACQELLKEEKSDSHALRSRKNSDRMDPNVFEDRKRSWRDRERKREDDGRAALVTTGASTPTVCGNCKNIGHTELTCEAPYCLKPLGCGKMGHRFRDCWSRPGATNTRPPQSSGNEGTKGNQNKRNSDNKRERNAKVLSREDTATDVINEVLDAMDSITREANVTSSQHTATATAIVDTGADSMYAQSEDGLRDITDFARDTTAMLSTAASGQQLIVAKTATHPSLPGEVGVVPGLSHNLISIPQLDSAGAVTIISNGLLLTGKSSPAIEQNVQRLQQLLSENLLVRAPLIRGLYRTDFLTPTEPPFNQQPSD